MTADTAEGDRRMLLIWEAWAKNEGNDGAAQLFRRAADRCAVPPSGTPAKCPCQSCEAYPGKRGVCCPRGLTHGFHCICGATFVAPPIPTTSPRCKCGDPTCQLWRDDVVCPRCSAALEVTLDDPDFEGKAGDMGDDHDADCPHGPAPTEEPTK